MTGYFRELAFELRLRDYEEEEIGRIITRAESLVASAGTSPQDVLGSVKDYAGSFPTRASESHGRQLSNLAYVIVTALGAAYLVLRLAVPSIDFGWRVGVYGVGVAYIVIFLYTFIRAWRVPRSSPDQG